jgi:uncharacterized protein
MGHVKRSCMAWLAGLLLATTPLQAQPLQGSPQDLPTVQLSAGMHLIRAQVAQTSQQRQIGLMHRRDMGPNDGMLFVFEAASEQCFWMRNTLLPLDIAFLDDEGRVVNTDHMQPQTETPHCSAKPVRYVLEMHQGWFAKRGVRPGTLIGGGPFKGR